MNSSRTPGQRAVRSTLLELPSVILLDLHERCTRNQLRGLQLRGQPI
jgi:hypothetical protein